MFPIGRWGVHVPNWDELGIKHLWPDLKKDAAFNVYFQNDYPGDKGPNREYFFNILNTVYPEYLAQIMSHASKARFTVEGEAAKKQAIYATDEWYEALKDLPFKSSKYSFVYWFIRLLNIGKNGKLLHLLKKSSKPIAKREKGKVIPLLGKIGAYHAAS